MSSLTVSFAVTWDTFPTKTITTRATHHSDVGQYLASVVLVFHSLLYFTWGIKTESRI